MLSPHTMSRSGVWWVETKAQRRRRRLSNELQPASLDDEYLVGPSTSEDPSPETQEEVGSVFPADGDHQSLSTEEEDCTAPTTGDQSLPSQEIGPTATDSGDHSPSAREEDRTAPATGDQCLPPQEVGLATSVVAGDHSPPAKEEDRNASTIRNQSLPAPEDDYTALATGDQALPPQDMDPATLTVSDHSQSDEEEGHAASTAGHQSPLTEEVDRSFPFPVGELGCAASGYQQTKVEAEGGEAPVDDGDKNDDDVVDKATPKTPTHLTLPPPPFYSPPADSISDDPFACFYPQNVGQAQVSQSPPKPTNYDYIDDDIDDLLALLPSNLDLDYTPPMATRESTPDLSFNGGTSFGPRSPWSYEFPTTGYTFHDQYHYYNSHPENAGKSQMFQLLPSQQAYNCDYNSVDNDLLEYYTRRPIVEPKPTVMTTPSPWRRQPSYNNVRNYDLLEYTRRPIAKPKPAPQRTAKLDSEWLLPVRRPDDSFLTPYWNRRPRNDSQRQHNCHDPTTSTPWKSKYVQLEPASFHYPPPPHRLRRDKLVQEAVVNKQSSSEVVVNELQALPEAVVIEQSSEEAVVNEQSSEVVVGSEKPWEKKMDWSKHFRSEKKDGE